MPTRKILTIIAATALVILTAACNALVPYIAPAPNPDNPVYVVGDSITWQANYSGAYAGTGWDVDAVIGVSMSHMRAGIEARRDAGTLSRLVIALGTNDSRPSNGGWTNDDANLWSSVIGNLHTNTQVVLVLPWLTESADAAHRVEVNEARAYMQTVADALPNVTTTDWQPHTVEANVMSPDGIHLLPTPEAIAAGKAVPVTAEANAAHRGVIALGLGQ